MSSFPCVFSLRLSLHLVVQIPCISGISLHFISLHFDMISLDGSVCGPMQHAWVIVISGLFLQHPFAMQILQGVDRWLSCNLGVDSSNAWFASSVPCICNCAKQKHAIVPKNFPTYFVALNKLHGSHKFNHFPKLFFVTKKS